MNYSVKNILGETLQVFNNLQKAIAYCEKMADQSILTHVFNEYGFIEY